MSRITRLTRRPVCVQIDSVKYEISNRFPLFPYLINYWHLSYSLNDSPCVNYCLWRISVKQPGLEMMLGLLLCLFHGIIAHYRKYVQVVASERINTYFCSYRGEENQHLKFFRKESSGVISKFLIHYVTVSLLE